MARRVCAVLRALGCRSLHIGGGEPFLDTDGLTATIRIIRESGIALDYIETNAAWITPDMDRNKRILRCVTAGGGCVMVSADPFHIEFIPFWKTKALVGLLRSEGVPYFIWQERYWGMLSKLDDQRTYTPVELAETLGFDAAGRCADEYGMGFNGRALNLIRNKPGVRRGDAESFTSGNPCPNLQNAGHFHVDFLGRYIPPGCTGMGVLLEDLSKPLDVKKYPNLSRLLSGGTAGLLSYARSLGYSEPPEGYVSMCDVCFQIRKFLHLNEPEAHPDITPAGYYRQDY
jgi:hypothetical protein